MSTSVSLHVVRFRRSARPIEASCQCHDGHECEEQCDRSSEQRVVFKSEQQKQKAEEKADEYQERKRYSQPLGHTAADALGADTLHQVGENDGDSDERQDQAPADTQHHLGRRTAAA